MFAFTQLRPVQSRRWPFFTIYSLHFHFSAHFRSLHSSLSTSSISNPVWVFIFQRCLLEVTFIRSWFAFMIVILIKCLYYKSSLSQATADFFCIKIKHDISLTFTVKHWIILQSLWVDSALKDFGGEQIRCQETCVQYQHLLTTWIHYVNRKHNSVGIRFHSEHIWCCKLVVYNQNF